MLQSDDPKTKTKWCRGRRRRVIRRCSFFDSLSWNIFLIFDFYNNTHARKVPIYAYIFWFYLWFVYCLSDIEIFKHFMTCVKCLFYLWFICEIEIFVNIFMICVQCLNYLKYWLTCIKIRFFSIHPFLDYSHLSVLIHFFQQLPLFD